jgi:tetratricopeptide (TPR) repeat protein
MKVQASRVISALLFFVAAAALSATHLAAQPASTPASEGAAAPEVKIPEVEEAAKIFRMGDYDNAMRALQAAGKKHPDLPPAEVVMAGWFASGNQPNMARDACQRAIMAVPNDPEPYQILGELAVRNREIAEAGLLFDKVSALLAAAKEPAPRLKAIKSRVLAGHAAVAQARLAWDAAQTHLEALIADDPKNALALQQLGQVLFVQNKEDLALEKLREAAKLDDTLLGAEATLAQLYHQRGDVKNAGKWMLDAIKANPRDAKTRVVAAQWSYDIGKFDQAEEQAKAAVQLDPASPSAQLIRGAVALIRKDFKTAQEFYEKAHLQSPSNLTATNNLVLALAGQDDESKRRLALEYAQINSRVYPDQSETLSTLGWALYRVGRLDEAQATLGKAISLPRATPDTFYFTARVFADRGRKDEARMLLQSPIMKTPSPYLMRKEAESLLEELSGR